MGPIRRVRRRGCGSTRPPSIERLRAAPYAGGRGEKVGGGSAGRGGAGRCFKRVCASPPRRQRPTKVVAPATSALSSSCSQCASATAGMSGLWALPRVGGHRWCPPPAWRRRARPNLGSKFPEREGARVVGPAALTPSCAPSMGAWGDSTYHVNVSVPRATKTSRDYRLSGHHQTSLRE